MLVTRIELINVPETRSRDVYASLHIQLQKVGFSKKIKSDQGHFYNLPDATYVFSGVKAARDVNSLAQTAAKGIGYDSRVITFDYNSASWSGLELERDLGTTKTV